MTIDDDDFKEALIDILTKINNNLENIAGSMGEIENTQANIEYILDHWSH